MRTPHTPLLLTKIEERQGELSDRAFSRVLGLPHTTYAEIRRGIRSLGMTFLEAIARTYPDLDPDICDFLRERGRPSDFGF